MRFISAIAMVAATAVALRRSTLKSVSRSDSDNVTLAKQRISETKLNPTENWYNSTIDHFDNHGAGSETYKMRYLEDNTFYDADKGPIIFYAGNEGDIYTFFDNSGFMTTTLAEQFGAKVIFAEHRYYGESMPFGDATFDKENLKYLTVEQAMMDYVEFILDYKKTNDMEDRAVIVGGGSYGGMLSAWLRMKYPHAFQGALAASAPILFFDGYVSPFAYDDIATQDFAEALEACPDYISKGFQQLADSADKSDTYQAINDIFGLCAVPTSAAEVNSLIGTIDGSLGTMAMVDYPYPTSFVEPLPAYPVNASCQAAQAAWDANPGENQALYAIAAAGTVFYNYAGQLDCLDVSVSSQGGGLDDSGWSVQACNEMVMPFASQAPDSMFPPSSWDETANTQYCQETYGLTPQYNWALDYFGGRVPERDFMKTSNIIFSNGSLDPWHAGGVLKPVSDDTVVLYIEGSAHHLDLRLPNEADPQTLTDARKVETETIAKWIDQYQGTTFFDDLYKEKEPKEEVFLQ